LGGQQADGSEGAAATVVQREGFEFVPLRARDTAAADTSGCLANCF
jgi:hypothetical protein